MAIPTDDFNGNVRRIQGVDRTDLSSQLFTKMIGTEAQHGFLGAKMTSGDMKWYCPEEGDAIFNTLKLTGMGASGSLYVDGAGNLYIGTDTGGEITASDWMFSTDTTASDPTNGYFKADNTDLTSATKIYISKTDAYSNDKDGILAHLKINDELYFKNSSDETMFFFYEVTGAPIDQTTYYEIQVTYQQSGTGTFTQDQMVNTTLVYAGDIPTLQEVTNAGSVTSTVISYNTHPSFSNNTQIVDKKYVDDAVASGGSPTLDDVVEEGDTTDTIMKYDVAKTFTADNEIVDKGYVDGVVPDEDDFTFARYDQRIEDVLDDGYSTICNNSHYVPDSTTTADLRRPSDGDVTFIGTPLNCKTSNEWLVGNKLPSTDTGRTTEFVAGITLENDGATLTIKNPTALQNVRVTSFITVDGTYRELTNYTATVTVDTVNLVYEYASPGVTFVTVNGGTVTQGRWKTASFDGSGSNSRVEYSIVNNVSNPGYACNAYGDIGHLNKDEVIGVSISDTKAITSGLVEGVQLRNRTGATVSAIGEGTPVFTFHYSWYAELFVLTNDPNQPLPDWSDYVYVGQVKGNTSGCDNLDTVEASVIVGARLGELYSSGTGTSLWQQTNDILSPVTDPDQLQLGGGFSTGKLDITHSSTFDRVELTGLEINTQALVNANGIYNKIDDSKYKHETLDYWIIDTGWWWVITNDETNAWNGAMAQGSGGRPTPVDGAYYQGLSGYYGDILVNDTASGSAESITAYDKIYSRDVIKTSSSFQVGNDMAIGRSPFDDILAIGINGAGVIGGNALDFRLGLDGGASDNLLSIKDNGAVQAPKCELSDITLDNYLTTKEYVDTSIKFKQAPLVGNVLDYDDGDYQTQDVNTDFDIADPVNMEAGQTATYEITTHSGAKITRGTNILHDGSDDGVFLVTVVCVGAGQFRFTGATKVVL